MALAAFLFVGSVSAQPRPSQSFEYDAVGNLTRSTDALNNSTQFTWDALGRPRLTTQPAPASGAPRPTIRTDHNPAGDLTRVTDPRGLATTYSVTGLGEVTSLVSPDTGTTTSTYDVAGNLKTSRDARGQTTTYTYDALNRPTRAQYGDGTATSFFYDEGGGASIGQLTRIVDPGSLTTTFTYDLHGRVLTRTQTVLNGTTPLTQTLTHTYTPGTGQRNKTVYPSGRALTFTYHPNTKKVQSVSFDGTVVAGALQWHALSSFPKRLRLANGQTWSSTLDLEGRVKSYALGSTTVTLTWDAANRLTQITNGTPSQNQSFAYDGLGRLTAFTSGARTQSFTYDASGNLTSKFDKVGAAAGQTDTFTIAPTSNRMTQIANLGVGFGYDAAGNRTSTSNISHTYNAKGRLTKTIVTAGAASKTYNFLYNALEQRVRKTGASGFTAYAYDDAGQLIGEYDNLGRATREYVWLPSPDGKPNNPSYRPIALITYTYAGTNTTPTSKAIWAIEADHLGAPRRVSSTSNQTRWTWTPAPFGDTLPNENPSNLGKFTLNLRFPGQYFDTETNLAYNHHRDYEATTGRYIQSDPIGLQGGINTYAYVGGNPLSYVDPEGLQGALPLPRPLPVPGAPGAGPYPGGNPVGGPLDPYVNPPHSSPTLPSPDVTTFCLVNPWLCAIPKAIDWLCKDSVEECKVKCDAAYADQMRICKMSLSPKAREACYARAANLYGECLANCK